MSTLQIYNTSVQFVSSGLMPLSSAIMVFLSEHILLHSLTTTCENGSRPIIMRFTENIHLSKLTVTFGLYGLNMRDSKNIAIIDTDIMSTSSGMMLLSTAAISISNVTVKQSKHKGIHISSCECVSISGVVVMHAQRIGIVLTNTNNIDVVNTKVSFSGRFGLAISFVRHICISNTSVTESLGDGINVFSSNDIAVFNTSLMFSCMKKFNVNAHALD